MKLDALLVAHSFVRVERPPQLWEAETDDERLIPLLGEMLAAPLSHGAVLSDMTLNVSNIVVEPDTEGEDQNQWPPPGEYVALTVSGRADLGPDRRWPLDVSSQAPGLLDYLNQRLITAGARFAYIRSLPSGGSVTVAFGRSA